MEYGAEAKSIMIQLDERGISYDPDTMGAYEDLAEDVTELHKAGLITQSQADRAREKLTVKIRNALVLV